MSKNVASADTATAAVVEYRPRSWAGRGVERITRTRSTLPSTMQTYIIAVPN